MLISIQSLILCAEPYYNEPGFERLYGTPQGDSESLKYSEEVFRNNLKYAVVGQLTNPPEGFEDVVRAHFYLKRDFLLEVKIDTNFVFKKFAFKPRPFILFCRLTHGHLHTGQLCRHFFFCQVTRLGGFTWDPNYNPGVEFLDHAFL